MDREEVFVLELLKNFIAEKPISLPEEIDLRRMFAVANIHTLSGIMGYMLMQSDDPRLSSIHALLRQWCLSHIGIFTNRAQKMNELIEKMDENKIDHLLFKGFVLKEFYPVPELRFFSDIDFLIHKEDRGKSDSLMREAGFKTKENWEPVFSYLRDNEYYEIHTKMMEIDVSDQADYKGYFDKMWDYAIQKGEHTYELKPEMHFIYLLTHIAKHIKSSGAGIRLYLDIALFEKHYQDTLDWKWVQRELKKLKLDDFANVVLSVVEKYLGVKSQLPLRLVKDDILEDFMAYTMEGGIFGHFGRSDGAIALKQQSDDESTLSRRKLILRKLFPKAETIKARYTYLQKMPWLLPIAWIHRLIITRDRFGEHAMQAKSIMDVDENEVRRLKRIYKQIGL